MKDNQVVMEDMYGLKKDFRMLLSDEAYARNDGRDYYYTKVLLGHINYSKQQFRIKDNIADVAFWSGVSFGTGLIKKGLSMAATGAVGYLSGKGINSFKPFALGGDDVAAGVGNKVNVELKFKEGWTEAQKAEAIQKCKALSEAETIKTSPKRSGTSASSRYKKANGADSVPSGNDVDHTIDLQLGGADDVLNMNPLDLSVNRSLGVQIKNAIKDYPVGTEFGEFTIK